MSARTKIMKRKKLFAIALFYISLVIPAYGHDWSDIFDITPVGSMILLHLKDRDVEHVAQVNKSWRRFFNQTKSPELLFSQDPEKVLSHKPKIIDLFSEEKLHLFNWLINKNYFSD